MQHFTYGSARDLEQFGIILLTGEACAIGTRVLCDLTHDGAKVVRAALGLPGDTKFAENWNTGSAGHRHVGSFLMPWELAPSLAVVGMFEFHGCDSVLLFEDPPGLRVSRTVEGLKLEPGESFSAVQDYVGQFYEYAEDGQLVRTLSGYKRSITPIGAERRGLSCVHQMTGRSA